MPIGDAGAKTPYSIAIISDLLESFSPPDGAFDPDGEWEHNYAYWVPLRGQVGKTWRAGSLTITRKQLPNGFRLSVKQTSRLRDREERLEAGINCAFDALATPLRWSVLSQVFSKDNKALDFTQCWVRGTSEPGVVRIIRTRERTYKVANALTGRWTIMEAVQRLPFKPGPVFFDFLDDMETLKLGHRLEYARDIDLELSGRRVKLHRFEHIGSGILPTAYWLDDSHRLLLAVGGLRAFIFDTGKGAEGKS